jgi:hypothetical protein
VIPEVPDAIKQLEDEAILDRPRSAPRCGLRIGDHTAEQATTCLERWLTALDDREARP